MQQVNLYRASLQKNNARSSAQKLLLAMGVVSGGLLILSLIYVFQIMQLEDSLGIAQAEQNIKMAQLEALQVKIQARRKDAQLQAEVDALMMDIANRQKVMKVLGQQQFGNIEGFVEHVSGLARQRINGLWLSEVRISQGGQSLGLKGQTLKAELLPRYLQRLSSEMVFTGKAFRTLLMVRDQEQPEQLVFELQGVGEIINTDKKTSSYAANGVHQ
ncbi:hypothetical protein MNBD_GAMMA25-1126 [hydrothermal vent metagenome]|uniref:MSHA biogenesis protein MshI n=1 Tax=hydrothermal vent metagenome TaxID=652676 RepID=A0A3B1B7J0_9ZZZZ